MTDQPAVTGSDLARALRTEARTLTFHMGRYHNEAAVDERYRRSAYLMEKAADMLQDQRQSS